MSVANRKNRDANKSLYAPKLKLVASKPRLPAHEVTLRKQVAGILDVLKVPGAIPSAVILKGLQDAFDLSLSR